MKPQGFDRLILRNRNSVRGADVIGIILLLLDIN